MDQLSNVDTCKMLEKRNVTENINPIFALIKSLYMKTQTKPWNDLINQNNVFDFINKD